MRITFRQAAHSELRLCQRSSVVFLARVFRGDGDLLRRDLQPAVCYCQIICSIKVIFFCIYRNGKAFRIQAHQVSRICINISTCGFSGLTFCKCYWNTAGSRRTIRSSTNAVFNCVPGYTLFLSIVFLCIGVACNSDLQFRNPDRIHVVIRCAFICSHLADFSSRLAAKMECTVISIVQVRTRVSCCCRSISILLNLRPADKPVAGTC